MSGPESEEHYEREQYDLSETAQWALKRRGSL